jgi:FKBP-type peptidyl-prolyl cis-trans isomerase FklB
MRLLFAWALSLTLCAGVVFAVEPGAKKPKASAPAKSGRANADEAEATQTRDEQESDDAVPDDAEENEGDESSADDEKPTPNGKKSVPRGAKTKDIDILKRVSYMIGVDMVRMHRAQGIDLVMEEFIQGIEDEFAGKAEELAEDEKKDLMLAMQSIMAERQAELIKETGAKIKLEGEKFLAENKKKEGVTTTKSGLQYKVLKSGKGKSPKATDTVTAHYKGTFIDGKEFQSSYKLGKPATLQVGRFIPGWIEALQLMKVGDKWRIVVPSKLAYDVQGMQDPQSGRHIIPPNATLIFELELLSINASGGDE